ncbi:MAG: hypothetical protein KAS63_05005 [Candidatus Heimdallarchaeota archaeon]|nr:hypothetical protein [Candidatus Heimdallarchaeota archaeon]MCK4954695.1 hypothetical protein [Candidatus Heimdallarchaeota archaeon]
MSESNVHYFKLLEKKYEIEEDIFKKLSDLQDLKKKIANQQGKRAKDNREREENLIKMADFEAKSLPDKALKSEVSAKKKEASIAQKDYKIRDFERKIAKVEEEIDNLELELKDAENDITAHETGTPVQEENKPPLEPTVLEDDDYS